MVTSVNSIGPDGRGAVGLGEGDGEVDGEGEGDGDGAAEFDGDGEGEPVGGVVVESPTMTPRPFVPR